nr:CFF_HP1_G0031270.mRNA.1.CDS.1 [Saccharomyces cerevisiae]
MVGCAAVGNCLAIYYCKFLGYQIQSRDGFVALFGCHCYYQYVCVKGYGEAEFVFSFIKVITVVGFIILVSFQTLVVVQQVVTIGGQVLA